MVFARAEARSRPVGVVGGMPAIELARFNSLL